MTEWKDFLATILAHPADDGPRLVAADWLEERGDQRGEFIRVQVELAATYPDGSKFSSNNPQAAEAGWDRYAALERRERELLTPANKRDWSRPLGEEFKIEFARGFVSGIRCNWSDFLAGRHVILGLHPIRLVTLDTMPALATFADGRNHCLHTWIDGLPEKSLASRGRMPIVMRILKALLRLNFPGIKFSLPIGHVEQRIRHGRGAQRQGSHEVPRRNPTPANRQPGMAGSRPL